MKRYLMLLAVVLGLISSQVSFANASIEKLDARDHGSNQSVQITSDHSVQVNVSSATAKKSTKKTQRQASTRAKVAKSQARAKAQAGKRVRVADTKKTVVCTPSASKPVRAKKVTQKSTQLSKKSQKPSSLVKPKKRRSVRVC